MELGSVRSLKADIKASVIGPMNESAEVRALGMQVGPAADAPAAPPTIALGVAPKNDKGQFVLAVRIQNRGLENSREVAAIRKRAKGEVDVQYIGVPVKRAAVPWGRKPVRPLKIGCSIGHIKVTAGTLGAFVQARADGEVLILSNNHVLANENKAKKGDAILQPGKYDGGSLPDSKVGELLRFIRLKREGTNLVDAAVATIAEKIEYDARTLTGLGKLAGLGDAALMDGDAVAKIGRTTGLTRGRVTAFEVDDVVIRYDLGLLTFNDQIEIEGEGDEPFSRGGDSGSLIVGADRRAVALLFAGGDLGGSNGKGLTYANPLRTVLDELKVDLFLG
ncbi:Nal1-like putative serine protease [Paludisphaera rhizosphaerae]|uniref:hypothetical protein n=1 Tax=Paludisphaera rhizosphaerae TaxID=2711216 RepID=UPI0013EBEE47|nr:hypothetical protein [Paludisphaera rhizosphaerae]